MKLIKLKLQGPSLAQGPQGPGRGPKYIFTFVPNFVFLILYSFSKRQPPKLYQLQAPQNLDPSLKVTYLLTYSMELSPS